MKIYTRTGDLGETSLGDGSRAMKNSLRVECYGTLDELNSFIGLTMSHLPPELRSLQDELAGIQSDLFIIGGLIAAKNPAAKGKLPSLNASRTTELEAAIDGMDAELPTLKNFILPGGSKAAATVHCSRSICRRAERILTDLQASENSQDQQSALKYLNRLSDFLFTAARYCNLKQNASEIFWKP